VAQLRELPADDLEGLLRQWSAACLARLGAVERPVAPAARTGSLLRPPATESAVAVAERRLGIHFPPSYRQFLLLSDGAYGDTMGALTTSSYRSGDAGEAWGFVPAAEVRPYVEVDPHAVEIWVELQDEIDAADGGGAELTPVFEGGEVRDHRPMQEALAIARGFDANCSLLVPVGGPGAGEEWEVWEHHKEGTTRWSSFRTYLHDTVEEHLGVDVDETEALLLVAGAESGDESAVQRLARVRSPEAMELLVEAARRGVAPHAVTRALARIGGREVVAVLTALQLESWQQQYVHAALARIGTPEALDHLAAVGAYWYLAQVGDPRAPAIAAAQLRHGDVSAVLAATPVLSQLPDPAWVPHLVAAYDRVPFDEVRIAILHALDACGASEEVRRRAPDLLDGAYGYLARALQERLSPPEDPTTSPRS
jgi:hypothetical protein